jgi:chemotaxis protein MotB
MSSVHPDKPTPMRKPPVPPHGPTQAATADTLEWEAPAARPGASSRPLLILAILSSVTALGLGYVAWQSLVERSGALAKLGSASAQVQALEQVRTRQLRSLTDLQAQSELHKQRVEQGEGELGELKAKLGATEARLNELEAQSEALSAHLAEFRGLTKQFQRMIDSGKLQISYRRGRMIVELPAAVLFESGRAELSGNGREALQEIAAILRKVPGKRFIVGGHTDDVPIARATGAYTSNWSLSAARAVTVTEALTESGLRENHLVAAGYGQFDPIASNGSERGRKRNRRIEIVLEPELAPLRGALADLQKNAARAEPRKNDTAPDH